ncbi:hypothetical protein BDF14DRAFT_1790999 [Spinellus fusiger]|nr:hypothetical protein BDF14DRAFT_1790999 [Spinellus fusiger]
MPIKGKLKHKISVNSFYTCFSDFNQDIFLAITLFSAILVLLSCIFSIYYSYWIYIPSAPEGKRNIGTFNRSILFYLVATFLAVGSFLILAVGKIWLALGIFHNLSELNVLFSLLLRNEKYTMRFKTITRFILLLLLFTVSLAPPWPFDVVFFKFFGLIIDTFLSISLIRLYYHNRNLFNKSKIYTPIAVEQEREDQARDSKDKKITNFMPPVHDNIFLIVIAAVIHVFGNILVTISNDFIMWAIFQFTYAVTFPLYACYVVFEPNSSRIQWYKISFVKEGFIFIACFIVSLSLIIIGALKTGVSL